MNLPQSDILPIKYLAGVFRNTTNSYKFYWFLAILEHLTRTPEPVITFRKLSAIMIASVWYDRILFPLYHTSLQARNGPTGRSETKQKEDWNRLRKMYEQLK